MLALEGDVLVLEVADGLLLTEESPLHHHEPCRDPEQKNEDHSVDHRRC